MFLRGVFPTQRRAWLSGDSRCTGPVCNAAGSCYRSFLSGYCAPNQRSVDGNNRLFEPEADRHTRGIDEHRAPLADISRKGVESAGTEDFRIYALRSVRLAVGVSSATGMVRPLPGSALAVLGEEQRPVG